MATTPSSPASETVDVDRERLGEALKTLAVAVDARATETARASVRVGFTSDHLQLAALSAHLTIQTWIDLDDHPLQGRALTVRHSAMSKAVAACATDTLEVEPLDEGDSERLKLVAGTRQFRLDALSAAEFGALPPQKRFTVLAELDTTELGRALEVACRCASDDDSRPHLQCVAVDVDENGELCLVASDSYRLAVVPLGVTPRKRPADPLLLDLPGAKGLAAQLRQTEAETVELSYRQAERGAEIRLYYEPTAWTFGALEVRFPRWRELVDITGEQLEVDGQELSGALKAVEAIWRKPSHANHAFQTPFELHATEDGARCRYASPEVGELIEQLRGTIWHGEGTLKIGFNPMFLRDMLKLLGTGTITAAVPGAIASTLFEADGRRYVLMPIRLPMAAQPSPSDDDQVADTTGT